MKKSIIIIAIIILVLLSVFGSIPLFFKPALIEGMKTTLNRQFNSEVQFEKSDISLFRNFPNITLELQNVVIAGKEEFENDSLLSIEYFRAKMNLLSLFRKTGRKIDEITLVQPKMNLIVGKTGNVNWDVEVESDAKPDLEIKTEAGGQEEPFSLELEKIQITDGRFVYRDREINLVHVFEAMNLDVKGKMYGSSTELKVAGKAERYSVEYGGVKYISNISLETGSLLKVDYEKTDIEIVESEFLVNRLPLQVTGMIQMPLDTSFFDLKIKTSNSDFKNFLALLPPGYEGYLENVETRGTAEVYGTLKGFYFNENYPAFDLKINVANGNINYTELPEEIKNIKAEVLLTKPQGEMDLTQVKVKNAHVQIGNNPVDLTLLLTNLFTDIYFDGAFVGKVNFDQLKRALPLDSVNVAGTIDANLFVKGRYSSVKNENYEQINSDGIVLLDNFIYDSPQLTQKILVPSGQIDFSPRYVNLSQLNVKIGQSNFNMSGKVHNYLNYIFKDGTLKGDLQLVSSFVNLNELLRIQKKVVKNKSATQKTENVQPNSPAPENSEKLVFDVPSDIDITFRSNIDRALFDKLEIWDIVGIISAQNGKLMLNGLNMNMLDGNLKLTGSYLNTKQNQPIVDFGLDVSNFDIPSAYQSLSGFQKMMPVAAQSQGKMSTNLRLKGQLTEAFKIIPATIDGVGYFSTKDLKIIESPVFSQLNGILLPEKLKNVNIEDFKANFNIENGNIDLKPFETRVAGQETRVFGTLSAENLVSLRLDFKVNRDAFGADIQNILSVIPGNQKLSVLPAGVIITGPAGNPEVKVDLSETRKVVTNAAKGELKNSLDQLGKGLKKLFEK